jgi:hypothetical protein
VCDRKARLARIQLSAGFYTIFVIFKIIGNMIRCCKKRAKSKHMKFYYKRRDILFVYIRINFVTPGNPIEFHLHFLKLMYPPSKLHNQKSGLRSQRWNK